MYTLHLPWVSDTCTSHRVFSYWLAPTVPVPRGHLYISFDSKVQIEAIQYGSKAQPAALPHMHVFYSPPPPPHFVAGGMGIH